MPKFKRDVYLLRVVFNHTRHSMDQAVSSVMKAFGPAKPGYILNRVGIFGCCNCI